MFQHGPEQSAPPAAMVKTFIKSKTLIRSHKQVHNGVEYRERFGVNRMQLSGNIGARRLDSACSAELKHNSRSLAQSW
jgi:hypothetical protein